MGLVGESRDDAAAAAPSVQVTLVVPCFNEANRLERVAFDAYLAAHPAVRLLFVDDGSSDDTSGAVRSLAAFGREQARLLRLERNSGKAEAVRAGLGAALGEAAEVVGFWDADLATPLECLDGFLSVLRDRPEIDWVIGARVQLLGRDIRRRPVRHYVGRVFATMASLALRLPVYDTQCGAKVFRASAELRDVIARPFEARWVFDVEMIARLIVLRRRSGGRPVDRSICEYPLESWVDVRGSKLRAADYLTAARDMLRIWLELRRA
jgi:glycosyltransferase involved in cell wall biosynthesis